MAGNGSAERILDLRKLLAIIRKNWMVLSRDPLRLRTLLLFPMVMIVLFGYTSGETPKHIPAALVDYDGSNHSSEVRSLLYSSDLFSIGHMLGSQDEGRKLIDSGDVKILFIIPQGFGADIDAGRTASLFVIVDESDPTVAQITRASTQGIVQGMSAGIISARAAALAARARGLQSSLSASPPPPEDQGQAPMQEIRAEFVDSRFLSAQTDSMLDSRAMQERNSIGGPIFDPNEIVDEYYRNVSTRAATYDMLTASDAQQPALAQISLLQGMRATNDRLAQDAAAMYSGSSAIYASLQRQGESLRLSQQRMEAASAEAGAIAAEAQKAAGDAIQFTEISPYGSGRPGLDFLIPSILATVIFQGAIFGMGRAIAGERQDGSMTRVFLTPTSNVTILSGTLMFYVLFETVRASILVLAAMLLFGVSIKGSLLDILVLIAIYAAGSTGLGMILSVMSKSQEQYMALSALVTLPSMLLSGVFIPIETMPPFIQAITRILPITYVAEALRGVMIKGFSLGQVVPDIMFLAVFAILSMLASLMLFKRELI